MRADAALADRRKEVRDAAQGWRRAHAIDDATLAAIEAAYPDDRIRLRPVFRILAFIFTVIAVSAVLGLFVLFAPRSSGWLWVLLLGVCLTVLTEFLVGVRKRSQGGIEEATAVMGVIFLIGGVIWCLDTFEASARTEDLVTRGLAVVLFAAAAALWGFWVAGAISAVSFFYLLTQASFGHSLWIVCALILIPILTIEGDSSRLAPAHRRSCQAALIVSLVALYLSVNVALWDKGLLGWRYWTLYGSRDSFLRLTLVVATGVIPLVILLFGIKSRRRIFLILGLVFGIASLVTLRFYFQLAPLWVILTVAGSVAIALGLALRRFLDSGPAKERAGFTAEPLFEDITQQSPLEVAATVVALSPEARALPAETDKFTGGGGSFGGGGASGKF